MARLARAVPSAALIPTSTGSRSARISTLSTKATENGTLVLRVVIGRCRDDTGQLASGPCRRGHDGGQ
jgi:hypothetical protein